MPESGPMAVAKLTPKNGSTVRGLISFTQRGDKVAMREKHLGIWRAISWREYHDNARHVGLGLNALGLRPEVSVPVICQSSRRAAREERSCRHPPPSCRSAPASPTT